MATMKEVPGQHVIEYAAGVFGFTPKHYRAIDIYRAARIQLAVKSITVYPYSLSHMLLTAAHDAQRTGLKKSVADLATKCNNAKAVS